MNNPLLEQNKYIVNIYFYIFDFSRPCAALRPPDSQWRIGHPRTAWTTRSFPIPFADRDRRWSQGCEALVLPTVQHPARPRHGIWFATEFEITATGFEDGAMSLSQKMQASSFPQLSIMSWIPSGMNRKPSCFGASACTAGS